MRFINMNELRSVRNAAVPGQPLVGRGSFATIYGHPGSSTVTKFTTDHIGYALLTDGYMAEVRSHVETSFPRVVVDHGAIGRSKGLTAYMVEMERLYPISTTEHRRLIRRWMAEYSAFSIGFYQNAGRHSHDNFLLTKSAEFCRLKAEDETEVYATEFAVLEELLLNFGGALDLKGSNFMERSDGTLVWNDVVFDAKIYMNS